MQVRTQQQMPLADSLQRFQHARELAARRINQGGSRDKLIDLIKEKQDASQTQGSVSEKTKVVPASERNPPEVAEIVHKTLKKANELLLYSADSHTTPKPAGKKLLGNYVDLVALEGIMDNTIGTGGITGPTISPAPFPKKLQIQEGDKTSFGDMFKTFVNDVNHMQNHAGESIQKMLAGEIKDPHQVMLAVGEAKMALNLLIEIRNKVMEGYQELMNIRV